MYQLKSNKRKYLEYSINNNKLKKTVKDEENIDETEEVPNLLDALGMGNSGTKDKNKKIERDANHVYFYSEMSKNVHAFSLNLFK